MSTSPSQGTIGGFPPTGTADKESLEAVKRFIDRPSTTFDQQLLATADAYYQAVERPFRLWHRKHETSAAFMRSQHFIDIDPDTGEVMEFRPDDEYAVIDNQFESMIDAKVSTFAVGAKKLVAKCSSRDKRYRQRLRDVQHWVNSDRPFDVEQELQMGYQWVLYGEVWVISAPTLTGPTVQDPQTEATTIGGGPTAYFCPECEAGGYLDEAQSQAPAPGAPPSGVEPAVASPATGPVGAAPPTDGALAPRAPGMATSPACPECGGTSLEVTESKSATVDKTIGFKPRQSVLIESELVPSPEMYWYVPAKRPKRSPWIERRRWVLTCEAEAKFPNVNFRSGASGQSYGEVSDGADVVDRMAATVPTATGDSYVDSQRQFTESDAKVRVLLREIWLRPVAIARVKSPENRTLANGRVIPEMVPFSKLFPKGLCATVFGKTIIDIRPAEIDKEIVYGAAKLTAEGGYPRASESMISNQKRVNFFTSYEMQGVATTAVGVMVADADTFRGTQMRNNLGIPGSLVMAEGLLPNEDVRSKVYRVRGEGPAWDIAGAKNSAMGSMQGQNGSMSVNPLQTGSVGPSALDTATGVNAITDLEKRLQGPMLRLLYATLANVATSRFSLGQTYAVDPMYLEAKDPLGREVGRELTLADIDGDYFIEPDPEAFQSRSNSEKKIDLQVGIGLGAFNPQVGPEQMRAVQRTYGIDELGETNYLTWQEKSYDRLDKMKTAADEQWPDLEMMIPEGVQMFQEMVAAGVIPSVMPDGTPIDPVKMILERAASVIIDKFDPKEDTDRDDVFIETYVAYKSTSEAEEDNPLAKTTIALAFTARKRHIGEVAVKDQLMAAEVAAPLNMAGAQLAGDAAAADEKRAIAESDDEAEKKEAGAEADHERQERSKDAEVFRNANNKSGEPTPKR